MSNEGKFRDPIPKIRAAGKVTTIKDESAAVCVKPPWMNEPGTPEHIRKYRKEFNEQPGVKQIHYGIADDPKRDERFLYGKKTEVSDHVSTTIKYPPMSKLAEYANDLHEAKYASHKREPLGKVMPRDYKYPETVTQEGFMFGAKVIPSESAKNVLFPEGGEKHEAPEVEALYLKTHGAFAPGEQKQRSYNWPVDKKDFRFGYVEERELDGAARCVQPERYGTSFPTTKILKKTVEDYTEVTKDELGKGKNLGQAADPNMIFGTKPKRLQNEGEWNAALCIHGDPVSEKELEPDVDLGRCTKMNCTNTVRRQGDESRVFGVPTVRNDIPKKAMKSVADHQNYGDEPEAIDLLFPSTFLELGITEEDFNLPRSPEELRLIFENIGFKYKIGKFQAILNRALEYSQGKEASVRHFLEAVKELHFIE